MFVASTLNSTYVNPVGTLVVPSNGLTDAISTPLASVNLATISFAFDPSELFAGVGTTTEAGEISALTIFPSVAVNVFVTSATVTV